MRDLYEDSLSSDSSASRTGRHANLFCWFVVSRSSAPIDERSCCCFGGLGGSVVDRLDGSTTSSNWCEFLRMRIGGDEGGDCAGVLLELGVFRDEVVVVGEVGVIGWSHVGVRIRRVFSRRRRSAKR